MPADQVVAASAAARAAPGVEPTATKPPASPLPRGATRAAGQVRCAPSRAARIPSGGAKASSPASGAEPSQCSPARGEVAQ